MKKYIILLSTFCLGLVSCVKEDMSDVEGMVTFKASYEETSTRTVLEGLAPKWTPTDKISVYDGENNVFANVGSSVSSSAQFKGTLAGKGRKYYLAAYPYEPALTFAFLSKTVYGIVIPAEQKAFENTYDPAAAPAIAYTEDFSLSFKNVCSLVKFRIVSEGVTSVTINANGGEYLSGKFNASWADSPRITVTGGEKTVTMKGDFKIGETYFISTLPMVLTEGLTVTLNGNVVTMKETYQMDLARSGMVNLGDLSLDPSQSQKPSDPDEGEDEAVASDWILLGEHNEWGAADATPMYEIGSNYVAFDVPASVAGGFKFNNGDTWVGTTAAVALNEWVKAQGEGGENISFAASEGALYDIYFANSLDAFYITAAGSQAPEPAPKPFVGMAVAGTFNSWSTSATPAVDEGEYYVVRGIKAAMASGTDAGDKGFKFVYSEENGTQAWYGASSATVALSKWHDADSDGGAANIYVSGDASADYDVYITKDRRSYCVVPAGEDLPSADQKPDPDPVPDPDGQVIYLNAGGSTLWDQADAWFEAWSWATGAEGAWFTMSSVGSGMYQCTIPSGNDNIIFVRRGPDMSQGWEAEVHYWNKTDDLAIPSGMNCYTITGWGGTDGSWSTK